MIFGIIKVEIGVISRSGRPRLVTLTKTLIILDVIILLSEKWNLIIIVLLYIEQNKNGSHVLLLR